MAEENPSHHSYSQYSHHSEESPLSLHSDHEIPNGDLGERRRDRHRDRRNENDGDKERTRRDREGRRPRSTLDNDRHHSRRDDRHRDRDLRSHLDENRRNSRREPSRSASVTVNPSDIQRVEHLRVQGELYARLMAINNELLKRGQAPIDEAALLGNDGLLDPLTGRKRAADREPSEARSHPRQDIHGRLVDTRRGIHSRLQGLPPLPPRQDRAVEQEGQSEEHRSAARPAVLSKDEEIADLREQLAAARADKKPRTGGGDPFTRRVKDSPMTSKVKFPKFEKYDGHSNALNHVVCYEAEMSVVSDDSAVRCWGFVKSLSGKAVQWYARLPENSVDSWETFKKLFLKEFAYAGDLPKEEIDLVNIKQKDGETNLEYYERFKKVHDQIDGVSEDFAIKCFQGGLAPGSILKIEFASRTPEDRSEMFKRAKKIASAEAPRSREEKSVKKATAAPTEKSKNKASREVDKKMEKFTPLNTSREQIMIALQKEDKLPEPRAMSLTSAKMRDKSKHCKYHGDYGHLTEDCLSLKRAIQRLIDQGSLNQYKAKSWKGRGKEKVADDDYSDDRRAEKIIYTINTEYPSTNQLKNQINSLIKARETPILALESEEPITFSPGEVVAGKFAQEQPIVISATMFDMEIRRVLVDTGAGRNILFYSCFQAMGLTDAHLNPTSTKLEGFTMHQVSAKGVIEMAVTIGRGRTAKTANLEFMVVDVKAAYNVILGIPAQCSYGMLVSIPHQCVKYPTERGVGTILSRPETILQQIVRTRKDKQKLVVANDEERVTVKKSKTVEQLAPANKEICTAATTSEVPPTEGQPAKE